MRKLVFLFFLLPAVGLAQMSKLWFNEALKDKPSDLPMFDATFFFLTSVLADEMGYDADRVNFPIPKRGDERIGFGVLPKGTLAQARRVNNDCEIYIVINRNEWFNTYQQRRLWIYWHEMAHDAFNLKHGEGGELMNAYAPSGKITSIRLYNAMKEMVRYAIKYGEYSTSLGSCFEEDKWENAIPFEEWEKKQKTNSASNKKREESKENYDDMMVKNFTKRVLMYKEPDPFSETELILEGVMIINFANKKIYNDYYRKVKIRGHIGYVHKRNL